MLEPSTGETKLAGKHTEGTCSQKRKKAAFTALGGRTRGRILVGGKFVRMKMSGTGMLIPMAKNSDAPSMDPVEMGFE